MVLMEFRIDGNQEDPSGNPIPYTRTTARSKYRLWTKTGRLTQYARYCQFMPYVRRSLSRENERRLIQEIWPLVASRQYQFYLDCQFQFRGDRYADVDNVIKGLLDSLFPPKRKGGPDDHLVRGRPVAVRDQRASGWIRCALLGPFPRDEWPHVPLHEFTEIEGSACA